MTVVRNIPAISSITILGFHEGVVELIIIPDRTRGG
jgi:hypothetical protein